MSASLDVVVVNWNTGHRLRDCLESIVLAARGGVEVSRVRVVDNASTDGSADGLDDLPLPLEIVRNAENAGFAAACNQGAAGTNADFLLFLNPDTRLLPGTLEQVTRFMESEQARDVGICGVQLVDDAGHPRISCARFPTPRVLFGKITGLHAVAPGFFPAHQLTLPEGGESGYVDQVIGAFYFVRSDLFRRLRGFDERYFMYFEDVDFALRARAQGARSYVLTETTAFHAENVSSDQVRGPRLFYSLRSRTIFMRCHWPGWQAQAFVLLALAVELPARLVQAAFRGSGRDVVATASGYGRFLREGLAPRRASARRAAADRPCS